MHLRTNFVCRVDKDTIQNQAPGSPYNVVDEHGVVDNLGFSFF